MEENDIEIDLSSEFTCFSGGSVRLFAIIADVILHLPWQDEGIVCHDGFPYVGVSSFLHE